jgi:uncharacterized protein YdeI (YjbR/CyaY-like superfamily)
MDILFFDDPEQLRAWFEQHHASAEELFVGYYKKGSGKTSITWQQSVDEALCFGWIDSVRRSLDEQSYCNRFTPRKANSIWSAVNIARIEALTQEGRMHPAGLAAFERRKQAKSHVYSYEQSQPSELSAAMLAQFQHNSEAWNFFQEQAPFYRRGAIHWITSAKQEATRQRRLAQLISDSAQHRRLANLDYKSVQKKPSE